MSSVPTTAAQEVVRGETLIWSGIPRQGVFLRSSDTTFIPFSMTWAGFVVFWEWMAVSQHAPVFLMLWGIPFLLVGAYITVGRFFYDSALRRKTSYALTSQRIIIRVGATTHSFPLKTLPTIAIADAKEGRGTITFGTAPLSLSRVHKPSWPEKDAPPAFEQIMNARRVFEQIRAAQDAALASRAV